MAPQPASTCLSGIKERALLMSGNLRRLIVQPQRSPVTPAPLITRIDKEESLHSPTDIDGDSESEMSSRRPSRRPSPRRGFSVAGSGAPPLLLQSRSTRRASRSPLHRRMSSYVDEAHSNILSR